MDVRQDPGIDRSPSLVASAAARRPGWTALMVRAHTYVSTRSNVRPGESGEGTNAESDRAILRYFRPFELASRETLEGGTITGIHAMRFKCPS